MSAPLARLRVLLVSHGYPPWERAGVEQHVHQTAHALAARGHQITVLAATRAPGRPQYSVLTEADGPITVHRVVNNIPARPLAHAERDRAVEAAVAPLLTALRPDIVHLHHLQFLSSGLRFPAPVVLTLHDGWLWCPSGGTELLLPDAVPCTGPSQACNACYAAWRPVPTATARGLLQAAGWLAPLVAPERLHRLWARLPARLRRPIAAEGPSPVEPAAALDARQAALRAVACAAAVRLAPSRYLARRAEVLLGCGPVHLHENAPALPPVPAPPRRGAGPLVFLGTLARHKGPDLVYAAWKQAFPDGQPPLQVYGPEVEGGLVPAAVYRGTLDRAGVARVLREARALVVGSRWPENAPLVLLEARAAGCPIVAPDIGGIPELVEAGRDGWLYPPGDKDALARTLQHAVSAGPLESRAPPTVAAQVAALEAWYRHAQAIS